MMVGKLRKDQIIFIAFHNENIYMIALFCCRRQPARPAVYQKGEDGLMVRG